MMTFCAKRRYDVGNIEIKFDQNRPSAARWSARARPLLRIWRSSPQNFAKIPVSHQSHALLLLGAGYCPRQSPYPPLAPKLGCWRISGLMMILKLKVSARSTATTLETSTIDLPPTFLLTKTEPALRAGRESSPSGMNFAKSQSHTLRYCLASNVTGTGRGTPVPWFW